MSKSALKNISRFLYHVLVRNVDIDMEELSRRRIFLILNFLAVPLIAFFGHKKLQDGEYLFGVTDMILAGLLIGSVILLRFLKMGRQLFRLYSIEFDHRPGKINKPRSDPHHS
jgi:hypothetical protein